jgi:hypothetical protein
MDINLASIAGNLRHDGNRRRPDIYAAPAAQERGRFSRFISGLSVILVAVGL